MKYTESCRYTNALKRNHSVYICWSLQDINITDTDLSFSDDGAIDDLIKGRALAAWRSQVFNTS